VVKQSKFHLRKTVFSDQATSTLFVAWLPN